MPSAFNPDVATAVAEMLSRLGTGPVFAHSDFVHSDPFRAARLVCGATFHYNTVVHYSERVAGGPPYRYDQRAQKAGACVGNVSHPEVVGSSAGTITQFLVDEMRRNPLALLDAETRRWLEPTLGKLGRGFMIDDFEGPGLQPHASAGADT